MSTARPAATVLVYWRGRVILRRGLIRDVTFKPADICNRAMERDKTISLVNTELFPGRTEFDSVLQNLPAVVICPLGKNGVVVVGGVVRLCLWRALVLAC